ncbi:hypothetical protein Agub_g8231 [Astrephomene gubernaculifera]|uniref:ApaG domain-containing protein n=1 Tax=Astrephomene gubernaculifera TaxID=47775 RepID=A0AAD3HN28_9CHLO|nr:hypothetical protein Agub_g8231 [Astrephomene gubernaculifera]
MSKMAVLQVYRTFLRQARRMAKRGEELEFRKPVPDNWGYYGYSETGLRYQASTLSELLGSSPSLRVALDLESLDADWLRHVVRENFKDKKTASTAEVPRLMGEALAALRVLLEQLYLNRCSSSCTSDGVRVDATSKYSTQAGTPHSGRNHNLFSYRIRITNLREEPIQVMGREWTIKNDKGAVVVHVPHVVGNAVVGQQPIVPPNDCFEYISGTDLDTPSGLQSGRLEIAVLEGGRPSQTLMVPVRPFAHMRPEVQRQ